LRRGQAFFDVVRDAERPFSIAMAKTKVTVLGTQFDIVKHCSGAKISVFEGRVKVNTLRSAAAETLKTNDEEQEFILTNGQALSVDKVEGQGTPIHIQPENIGAWREGRLSYINTPLAEVIEDIGRYYPKELRLVGAGFSGLNVSATFKVDQLDTALAMLAKTLPIQFDVISDKLIVIRHKRAP
jgi:transmembrane sensor